MSWSVPTNHLRQQWAKSAHSVGLSLDPHLTNEQGRESTDYHGCIVTYHQVGLNPKPYRVRVPQAYDCDLR